MTSETLINDLICSIVIKQGRAVLLKNIRTYVSASVSAERRPRSCMQDAESWVWLEASTIRDSSNISCFSPGFAQKMFIQERMAVTGPDRTHATSQILGGDLSVGHDISKVGAHHGPPQRQITKFTLPILRAQLPQLFHQWHLPHNLGPYQETYSDPVPDWAPSPNSFLIAFFYLQEMEMV